MGRCTGRRRRRLPHASPAVSEADVNSFVDAADRVGVNHVVYLSTLGAEKNVIIPHHRIEKHIMGTDITYAVASVVLHAEPPRSPPGGYR